MTVVCFMILVTGLEFPFLAMTLGSVYGAFRPLYFMKNRLVGFVPGVLCLFGLMISSIYTCYLFYAATYDMKNAVVTH